MSSNPRQPSRSKSPLSKAPHAAAPTGADDPSGSHKPLPPPPDSPPPYALNNPHGRTPTPPQPPSPLISTLNRLSLSTSRPNLPPQEGYAARTIRTVSNSLQALSGPGREQQATGTGFDAGNMFRTGTGAADTPPQRPQRPPPIGLMRRASASLDTSAILYPTLENHPAPLAHPLLVLDLAALTAVPTSISNEQLLATLLNRLEPWVGEEGDGSGYCLIVLAAEDPDGKARALPGVAWWLWHWRRIPRKYRKNLKRLYIVHPSTMTKSGLSTRIPANVAAVLPILLPVLSPKSYVKLHTVPSLVGLARKGVSLAGVDVPLVTLNEEARVLHDNPDAASGHGATNMVAHQSQSWWGSVTSLLPWGYGTDGQHGLGKADSPAGEASSEIGYGTSDIDLIMDANEGHLPRALRDLSIAIVSHCTNQEGIFRRSPYTGLGGPIRAFFDLPISRQPRVHWAAVAKVDPLLPPSLYQRLLGSLKAPIIPRTLYPAIRRSYTASDIRKNIIAHLSPARAAVLDHTMHMAHHVLRHEDRTRMGAFALAIMFAPALIAGEPLEDAMLCMEPGRTLPPALANMASLNAAMADSDDEGEDEEPRGGRAKAQATKPDQQPNTLVGVLTTYISQYPAVAGLAGEECECTFGSSGSHTPVPWPPVSPQRGAWNLGGGRIAPPVET